MNEWMRHPVRRLRLELTMRRARRIALSYARATGTCPQFSARGFICTARGPHREHVAMTCDGREVDRWIAKADLP